MVMTACHRVVLPTPPSRWVSVTLEGAAFPPAGSAASTMPFNYAVASGDWRHVLVEREAVWAKAIHRVAAEGISPEQAVDEAIARIKQILSE
jgi:ABC-type glycerol-3-phosphate transport system substrate-binding protein